jgi:oligoendopeptidase F
VRTAEELRVCEGLGGVRCENSILPASWGFSRGQAEFIAPHALNGLTADDVDRKVAELRAQAKRLDTQIARLDVWTERLEVRNTRRKNLEELLRDLQARLHSASESERTAIVNELVPKIEIEAERDADSKPTFHYERRHRPDGSFWYAQRVPHVNVTVVYRFPRQKSLQRKRPKKERTPAGTGPEATRRESHPRYAPVVTTVAEAGAQGVRWDLTPLAPSEQAMKERLDAAVAGAASFVERWPEETIVAIEPPSLAELLGELAELRAARAEGHWWAFMLTLADGDNPAAPDVQAWVDGRLPRLDEATRHFELAWVAVPNERAEELAGDEAVAHDRHYLLALRRFRPFLRSPAEERVLAAREATASTAWQSLHSRTLGGLTARFDDGGGERDCSLAEIQAARGHRDRDMRRKAWETSHQALEPLLPLLAQCYDALVADRLAVDRLRGHADPIEPRNLENEIEGSVVEGLLSAAEAHYALAHRWFEVKARLLGLERLDAIDLYASAFDAPLISWDEGRRLAVEVFANLTPALAAHAEAFFTERRIDAELRRGKRYAFFSTWPSTRVPGFVLVNWSGRLLDLAALTHELGHGTHSALAARAQSDNSLHPGNAVGEVPSTFAELRLVDDLLAADDPLGRPMLARMLDGLVGGALVAAALARFEQNAYAARADGQALAPDRLTELLDAELAKVWGDAMSDELGWHSTIWATRPYFVHERFYTYAYVFAYLVAAGLLARSREAGFGERYERFLAAGGSASPAEALSMLGVDPNDPGTWDEGFGVIESWLDRISA